MAVAATKTSTTSTTSTVIKNNTPESDTRYGLTRDQWFQQILPSVVAQNPRQKSPSELIHYTTQFVTALFAAE